VCTECLAGKFSTMIGAASNLCSDCVAGKYSIIVGAAPDVCVSCIAGRFSTIIGADSDICVSCVAGKYSTLLGAASNVCTNCVGGKYSTTVVVVERGSEYILAHTGPRELDGRPLGGCPLNPHRGCPSNSLGPVWANMYSDPLSTTRLSKKILFHSYTSRHVSLLERHVSLLLTHVSLLTCVVLQTLPILCVFILTYMCVVSFQTH